MLTYMGQEAVAVPCGETPVVSGHAALLAQVLAVLQPQVLLVSSLAIGTPSLWMCACSQSKA